MQFDVDQFIQLTGCCIDPPHQSSTSYSAAVNPTDCTVDGRLQKDEHKKLVTIWYGMSSVIKC